MRLRKSPTERRRRQAGFVITLEFLLVFTLVILPLGVGLIMLARKAFTVYLNYRILLDQPFSRAVIWDGAAPPNAKAIGQVIGYDRVQAPLVLFRDAVTGAGIPLGVRPNRFTSVPAVYYEADFCDATAGAVYVRGPLSPLSLAVPVPLGPVNSNFWPGAGFDNQLYGVNFAMGNGNILYKNTAASTDVPQSILSVWISQDTSDLSPSFGGTSCVRQLSPIYVTSLFSDGVGEATVATARDHYLESHDWVVIAGADPAAFNGIVEVNNVIGPRSFTYSTVALLGYAAGRPTVAMNQAVNLAPAIGIVNFDDPTVFTPGYRLAYPSAVPVLPPAKVCPGSEGC